MEFRNLREQLTIFAEKIQALKTDHESKMKQIREIYAPSKIPEYLQQEESRYKQEIQAARVEAANKLNTSVKLLEESQGGISDKIDTSLLSELNTIASSGMGLTAAELKNLGEKTLKSGSAICCRKLAEIATESGFDLNMPDPAKARDVLYSAASEIMNFYKSYSGSTAYDIHTPIDQTRFQHMANGNFLKEYETKFERATSSNLQEVKKAYVSAEESGNEATLQNVEEQFKAMVQSTDIPEKKPSKASEYAKQYSQKMAPSEFVPTPGMPAPDPSIKCKRAPRPQNRPDMNINTSASKASEFVKQYNARKNSEATESLEDFGDVV